LHKRTQFLEKLRYFSSFPKGSELYAQLLDAGLDRTQLDGFIESGHRLKSERRDISPDELEREIDRLLDAGGMISGGAALSYIFQQHNTQDIDIYFNNEIEFIRAILSVQDNPLIDICFYIDEPYEFHDLGVTRCSVSRDGQSVSPLCQTAMDTRVCDVIADSVIWPRGTARRIIKYAIILDMKFKADQIISLGNVFKLGDRTIQELLRYCS
jgi:hypothetical protein